MADIARLEKALINADAAGDTEAATVLADAIRSERAAMGQGAVTQDAPPEYQGAQVNEHGSVTLNQEPGYLDQANSFVEGVVDGVPIVGGHLVEGARSLATKAAGLVTGEPEDELRSRSQAISEEAIEAFPKTNIAGQVAGAIGSLSPVGATTAGAKALGIAGKTLARRAGAAATSGAAISAADTAARGGDAGDAGTSAAIGGIVSGAVPLAGSTLARAARKVADNKTLSSASRRVRDVLQSDKKVGGRILSDDDVAFAAKEGLPLINADRGGEATRGLLRSAVNTSPEANQIITSELGDRFAGQSERLIKFIRGSSPKTNAVGALDELKEAARKANKPAYDKAFSGNFKGGNDAELAELARRVPATAMRDAIRIARGEGRPFGEQLVASIDEAADTVTFSRAPSLREWHYIQIGLRDAANAAYKGNKGGVGATYKDIHRSVLDAMDRANPDYAAARRGAAAAFGEQDALAAGRSFARSPGKLEEFKKAMEGIKVKPAERKLFQVGYAHELIDQISKTGDSNDVVKRIFGTPAGREKFKAAFGAKKARKMEAMVRVEGAMNLTRQALGNSTTARQLSELGMAGGIGGGTALYTGDWTTGIMAGVAATGAKRGYAATAKKINQKVQKSVADILTSQDPKRINNLISRASREPQWMAAVDQFSRNLAVPTGVVAATE